MDLEEQNRLIQKIKELEKKLTESKDAELKLKQERERFFSLVSNIPGAVYRCEFNSNWRMFYISDAIKDISGYPASDFFDEKIRTFSSIIHPADRIMLEKNVIDAVEENKPYTIEYRIIDSNGEIHWVYEKGQAVFGDNEEILWLDGVIFDITEFKRDKEEKDKLFNELENALDDIKKLKGLLPICARCKNIRDDKGYWNRIETYIETHTKAMFTHGLCPKCEEELYGDEEWYSKRKNKE